MSKKANKTMIGAFVVGAVALIVSGVLIFGSGKFLKDTRTYVLFFQGSVKGLAIGAPVMFRGVKVGQVTDIVLRFDPSDMSVYIPVIIEVEPERFQTVADIRDPDKNIKELVKRGLRAQLQVQSIVTGQLMIDFDFYPDQPERLVGIESKYHELPTIPSSMEKLAKTIENLPLDELFARVIGAVNSIRALVDNPDVTGSFSSLNAALKDAQKLVKNVNDQVEPLTGSIKDASDAARGAFVQAEKTLSLEDGAPGELVSSIKETFSSANDTMKQAEETLLAMKGVASEDSNLTYELNNTLRELSAAARSIRFLADYLDRHPEALLRGKGNPKRD